MTEDRNPQIREMSDASMVRTLASQAELIWPQEQALFTHYDVPDEARILDVGCGTGEISFRLADLYPRAEVVGVDIVETHLAEAKRRYRSYGERLRFQYGDAFELPYRDGSYDLVVCRHMIQSVPDQEAVIRELMRVTRPGGRIHLLAEDYGMVHVEPGEMDPDRFWQDGPIAFGEAIGTDLRIGRHAYHLLHNMGASAISIEYVIVDTVRCSRMIFAEMMEAWRDGFTESIAAKTSLSVMQTEAYFNFIIGTIRDPARYAVWFVPVISAIKP